MSRLRLTDKGWEEPRVLVCPSGHKLTGGKALGRYKFFNRPRLLADPQESFDQNYSRH